VQFRVNGMAAADFVGKVRRVDASADAATRQLAVLVDFAPGASLPKIAGLYAEGQIASSGTQALMLPEAAIAREGDKAYVWRLVGTSIAKTPVQLGERDARRGEVVIASGLAAGAEILRNPAATLIDGQKFERTRKDAPPAASAPAVLAASAGR
jgi:multidrug efflux pump subunit AcrA (membrane-fusion protein)